MIVIDPQQELFIALKQAMQRQGLTVYDDQLPPAGTPYPFVYLGDVQQIDTGTKTANIGWVHPTIHVYGLSNKRGSVSGVILNVKRACIAVKNTKNFRWAVRGNINTHVMPDNRTATPLLHGIVEPEFLFS